jgi:hypothetical protein
MKPKEKLRPIDIQVKKSISWWSRDFLLIERAKIKNWQVVFVIAFLAGIVSAIVWSISSNIHSFSRASNIKTDVNQSVNRLPDLEITQVMFKNQYDELSNSFQIDEEIRVYATIKNQGLGQLKNKLVKVKIDDGQGSSFYFGKNMTLNPNEGFEELNLGSLNYSEVGTYPIKLTVDPVLENEASVIDENNENNNVTVYSLDIIKNLADLKIEALVFKTRSGKVRKDNHFQVGETVAIYLDISNLGSESIEAGNLTVSLIDKLKGENAFESINKNIRISSLDSGEIETDILIGQILIKQEHSGEIHPMEVTIDSKEENNFGSIAEINEIENNKLIEELIVEGEDGLQNQNSNLNPEDETLKDAIIRCQNEKDYSSCLLGN